MQTGNGFLNRPVLRQFQIDVRDRARRAAALCGKPTRVILQAATGAGKSVIGLDLILRCYEMGKRALFIVSGRTLVNQFEGHLLRAGVPFGIIMAGRGFNNAPVQLASKETLTARVLRRSVMELPPADLVVIDEAHESCADEWLRLLERYNHAVVVGLTATPALGNGKGLGHVYGALECAIPTRSLVEQGFLVPCRVFAPDRPNLRGVKLDANGDYIKSQLAVKMNVPKITGSVLDNWKKYADGRRTVVFGCTIDHAKHLCDEFNAAGIRFRHIDQTTTDEEREEIFDLIEDGLVKGFTNVSVARRGLDLPCLEVACVVRPTRSLVLWLQMIGRIRRPAPGKTESIVLDHAGACDNHCMPDDEIEWSLDSEKKINDWLKDAKERGKIPKQTVCPNCSCVFTLSRRCPSCGHEMKEKHRSTKTIEHADGVLVEVDQKPKPKFTFEDMQRYWHGCVASAVHRGVNMSSAVHVFKNKFRRLPWDIPGLQPMPEAHEWKMRADILYPGYKKVKVKA